MAKKKPAVNLEFNMGNVPVGAAKPKLVEQRERAEVNRRQLLGRTNPKGKLKLRSLSRRHMQIISMHLTGDYSGVEIAEIIGCSAAHVYSTLQDPMSLNIIEQFRQGQLQDLEALMPKAVDAVRDGLNDDNTRTRLAAVDRFVRMKGEDRPDNSQANVSIIVDARARFVEALKDVTPHVGRPTTPTEVVLEASDCTTESE